jgi:hypothetical protein
VKALNIRETYSFPRFTFNFQVDFACVLEVGLPLWALLERFQDRDFAGNVARFCSFSMLGRMLLFPIMLVFVYFYCSYIGSIQVIRITRMGSFLVAGEGVSSARSDAQFLAAEGVRWCRHVKKGLNKF